MSWGNRLEFYNKFRARRLILDLPDADTPALMLASVPLTDEGWSPLPEASITALKDGVEVARV